MTGMATRDPDPPLPLLRAMTFSERTEPSGLSGLTPLVVRK